MSKRKRQTEVAACLLMTDITAKHIHRRLYEATLKFEDIRICSLIVL